MPDAAIPTTTPTTPNAPPPGANGVAPPAPGAPPPEEHAKVEQERLAKAKAATERAREAAERQREMSNLKKAAEQANLSAKEWAEVKRLAAAGDEIAVLNLLCEKAGLNPERFGQALRRHGSPDEESERRFRTQERELADTKAALKKLEESLSGKEQQELISKAKSQLSDVAASKTEAGAPRFPHANDVLENHAEVFYREIDSILVDKHATTGRWLAFEDAVDEFEKYLAALRGPAATPDTNKPNVAKAPGTDAQKPATSRTLTNSLASQSYSAPPDIDSLPRKERMKHLAAEYEARAKKSK